MAQHTVRVWDKPHVVQTHQKSRSLWIAVGDYMGERLATQDRSEATSLKRWAEAAKYKGG